MASIPGPAAVAAHSYGEVMAFDAFHRSRSFAGGVLIIVGARVAGGCTSGAPRYNTVERLTCGHGISGVSELGLESFAGCAAIFGGAIGTGMAIEYIF
eukprot:gene20460-biopygen77079